MNYGIQILENWAIINYAQPNTWSEKIQLLKEPMKDIQKSLQADYDISFNNFRKVFGDIVEIWDKTKLRIDGSDCSSCLKLIKSHSLQHLIAFLSVQKFE